jgi:hypothetical protein
MSNLQIVFVGLAASMSLLWLLLAFTKRRSPELPGLVAVLRYGTLLRMGGLMIALAQQTVMIYFIVRIQWRTDTILAVAGLSFLLASVVAGLPLIEMARVQIALAEDSITHYSPWTGTRTLRWSEVDSVGYSVANRWFVLSSGERTIRVSRHLDGIAAFVDLVKRKVAAERWASATAAIDSV